MKRASGKLLHLRSRSSDTVCETSASQNMTASASAPKATVGGTGISVAGGGVAGGAGGAHPPAAAVMGGLGVGGLLQGAGGAGNTLRMSAAASSAAAHAAASAAFGGFTDSSPAGSSGSGSGSVLSSWTGGVSALSPPRREGRAGSEEGEDDGDVEVGHRGGGMSGRGRESSGGSPTRTSGSVLDAALVAVPDDRSDGDGGVQEVPDELRRSAGGEKEAVEDSGDGGDDDGDSDCEGGDRVGREEGKGSEAQGGDGGDEAEAPVVAAAATRPPSATAAPGAAGVPESLTGAPPAPAQAVHAGAMATPRTAAPAPERPARGGGEEPVVAVIPASIAQAAADFSTARTVLTVAFGEPDEQALDAAEAGASAGGGGSGSGIGGARETFQQLTPPPSGRFPPVEEV